MNLVFDMDGVIADFELAAWQRFGPCDRTVYSLLARWPAQADDVRAFVTDPSTYANLPAIPRAWAGLRALAERGHTIIVVTARPPSPEMRAVTHQWLAHNWMQVQELHLVRFDEKASYIHGLAPHAAFDDAPLHVEAMRALGVNAVVFDQPWNQSVAGPRVSGWAELLDSIES